jgi:methylmalonyl-CoA decarboxylase subunit alpha
MESIRSRLDDLARRDSETLKMGGEDPVDKQHKQGKLSARERIGLFFDQGSFQEIDRFVHHRASRFGMDKQVIPSDGVVTGHGLVAGRPVFAFFQDFTARGGSLGEMHSAKICKILDLALKSGAPVVGFNDSGGARIQEGIDSLRGYGDIFFRNARSSGVIPQISAIMGPCAGGAVYSPAMTDWTFMTEKTSYMYITGPAVIKAVTGEDTTHEDLGGAAAHNVKSGVAQFSGATEQDTIAQIRKLLSYLPSNNIDDPPFAPPSDAPRRLCPELDTVIPDSAKLAYDIKTVIESVVDQGSFFEASAAFAQNIVTAFARVAGHVVGIVANQPAVLAGCLDINASDKAARFIRFCDAFNIPLISFVDVPGYLPGSQQEWGGIIRHGAKLLWSYSEATVPKLTVITRKAYGGAYIAMSSRHLGADMVFAWPTAEIAVMGAEGAVNIIYRREIDGASDPEAARRQRIEEYEGLLYNPYIAAERGYIDAVIKPAETRIRLVAALELMKSKSESLPAKKHGNIPL